ncbi:MAG TPA: type II toxin-antitoxin system prevent-host-death family antitoxin [Bryobacteraceae bacterium]|nr:type II toxin-antitoxin system prevent-host-death family antitoxin [Bryobacteraceae bacterium]
MITQSISEARRKLAELIELARSGEEVVIIKDSKPVAALTPIDDSDLELVRLTAAQARRLKQWARSEPGMTFRSTDDAVRYMKKRLRKNS